MGYATTRVVERVLASVGKLGAPAATEFEPACDVAGGGVLAAVPALLAQGLLRRPPSYQLPQGFYGIDSIFLVLALMALARIRSLEQLRYQAPGEWGTLLGLRSEEHTSELQSRGHLVCRLLLEKKNKKKNNT